MAGGSLPDHLSARPYSTGANETVGAGPSPGHTGHARARPTLSVGSGERTGDHTAPVARSSYWRTFHRRTGMFRGVPFCIKSTYREGSASRGRPANRVLKPYTPIGRSLCSADGRSVEVRRCEPNHAAPSVPPARCGGFGLRHRASHKHADTVRDDRALPQGGRADERANERREREKRERAIPNGERTNERTNERERTTVCVAGEGERESDPEPTAHIRGRRHA